MREPKLVYDCPVEELVGRKVINQSGYIGTIVPNRLFNIRSLPIEVKFEDITLRYRGDGYYRLRTTEVKFEDITLWYRGDGYYRLRTTEDWIKFVDETEKNEMTTNQIQPEEQRIAEIRRKAEKAHTLYRSREEAYYKVDTVTHNLIHVTCLADYDTFCFAFEDIEAEDKFFELTEIK